MVLMLRRISRNNESGSLHIRAASGHAVGRMDWRGPRAKFVFILRFIDKTISNGLTGAIWHLANKSPDRILFDATTQRNASDKLGVLSIKKPFGLRPALVGKVIPGELVAGALKR